MFKSALIQELQGLGLDKGKKFNQIIQTFLEMDRKSQIKFKLNQRLQANLEKPLTEATTDIEQLQVEDIQKIAVIQTNLLISLNPKD